MLGLALAVLCGTARLGVLARTREAEVLRLCGATDLFIRAPFLIEGALSGLIAVMLALGMVAVGFRLAEPSLTQSLGFALSGAPVFFDTRELLIAATSASMACGLASALAANVQAE